MNLSAATLTYYLASWNTVALSPSSSQGSVRSSTLSSNPEIVILLWVNLIFVIYSMCIMATIRYAVSEATDVLFDDDFKRSEEEEAG